MEADDILMNISEMKAQITSTLNLICWTYPEICQQTWTRILTIRKKMSYQTKGFVWLQMKKLVFFLEENLNKNTKTKPKSDMKVITDFFTSIGEERVPGQYPPKTLTVLWLDSSWVYS
jgi:hypothetical protein